MLFSTFYVFESCCRTLTGCKTPNYLLLKLKQSFLFQIFFFSSLTNNLVGVWHLRCWHTFIFLPKGPDYNMVLDVDWMKSYCCLPADELVLVSAPDTFQTTETELLPPLLLLLLLLLVFGSKRVVPLNCTTACPVSWILHNVHLADVMALLPELHGSAFRA